MAAIDSPLTSTSSIRVRYQETDQMGVVYHTNYIVWFEVGRCEFIRQFDIDYLELEKMGIFLPVVEVNCRYISPARFNDEVAIDTRLVYFSGSKMKFEYTVTRVSDGTPLATGWTMHIWVDRQMKRVDVEKLLPDLFQKVVPSEGDPS